MTHDVIVVGSGFAGGVMAARLAERGMRVLILERGVWRGPAERDDAPSPRRDFPRGLVGVARDVRSVRVARARGSREVMLNPRGLFELHRLGGINALTVSGVGGGSLVYLLLVAPEDDFFDAYPAEITGAEMSRYFDRVRSVLRPAPLPELPEKNVVFERIARDGGLGEVRRADLGVVFGEGPDRPETVQNAVGVEQQTCTYLGECVLGCPRRAKTTIDLTYLPLALRHGAELRVLAEVTSVAHDDGCYRVVYRDREARRERAVDAPRLILAAGALNTLRLLFLARDRHRTMPEISRALGRGFSANGDAFAMAWRTRDLKRSDHGPNGGGYLVRRDPRGRLRHVVLEGGVALGGSRAPRRLRDKLAASTFLNTIGRDGAGAELELRGEQLAVRRGSELDRSFFEEMHAELRRVGTRYGAARVLTGDGAVMTAHPMGGAAIGNSRDDGVVDHRGEVFGYPGLHVADGAAYPAPPGVPPSLTIAALAERQAELLVAEAGSEKP
ncbi:MAG: GMC oxidoreductase [Actinomycetota bacterium]|nr:GMC oxidoreductase [Actinomycetota bacterium]